MAGVESRLLVGLGLAGLNRFGVDEVVLRYGAPGSQCNRGKDHGTIGTYSTWGAAGAGSWEPGAGANDEREHG